jgi:hypothetical protein
MKHRMGERDGTGANRTAITSLQVTSKLAAVPTPTADDPNNATRDSGQFQSLTRTARIAAVPTPMAGSPATEEYNAAGNTDYSRRIVELASVPTPTAAPESEASHNQSSGRGLRDLMARVASVPTPDTGCSVSGHGHRGGKNPNGSQSGVDLKATANLAAVPTPRANENDQGNQDAIAEAGSSWLGQHRGATLSTEAKLMTVASPSARDRKDTSGMSETGVDPDGSTRSRLDHLPRQAQLAASGQTATGGTGAMASTGQLDPAYSRWLMGVPPAWDGFACTAMQSVSRRRPSLSAPSSKPKPAHNPNPVILSEVEEPAVVAMNGVALS